ncbi:hypothetical protein D7I39_01975 [Allopusillimonas ginsengisoli]|nr:hypothetical protein D7I39_01975 [Allopusillimonas ginsengisoli]
MAAGTGTKASGGNAAAIGTGAIAEGAGSVAVGDGAKTLTPSDGSDPIAAIAIGKDSVSSGAGSTAIGHEASASGGNTLAFGTSATASGANGIAMGEGAVAAAQNNISIGSAAGFSTTPNLPNDNSHNIAIGAQSGQNVKGQFNVTMGDQAGSGVDGNENVAFGRQAGVGVDGDANVSIGSNANTGRTANRAVSIGEDSKSETEGVAIGYLASAGNTGVALGRQTTALGTGTAVGPNAHADSGHVALGLNSQATQADVSGSSAFTNRSFSGSAVSVGSSAAGGEFTRRIVNVEDGAQETDAVNVRQLQQAVSGIDLSDIDFAGGVINNLQTQIDQNMQQYVSINDGGTDKGNKNNNGAVATDSIAIGPDATTKNRDAIAIGHMAGAEGDSAVVLGHNIKGLGKNSTTVGNSQSEARDESGVAIGTHVISRDENSIVIGRDSYTDRQDNGPSVKNSIVIGTQSSSTAVEGIVIGKDSVVNADRGIAQGSAAHATAANAMAFGTGARGAGVDSQASGTGAGSYAERGIALGAKARSGQENPNADDLGSNRDSIAIGSDSVAEMNSSIAAGRDARATANFAQALGYKAQASGVESIAQGSNALALGQQAIAMGAGAQSTAASALAMGTGAHSTAGNAIAMGAGAQSTAAGAVAIGRGATAENGRSVALGDGAATDGPVGTANATLNNLTYGNFAGTAPIATVSVGTAGEKRTITNAAAGRISGASTDAINGSQLYATNAVLGNVANTTKGILGGNAVLNPNGSLSMTDIGNTGEDNVHDAIKYAAQGWNLSTNSGVASNVAPGGEVDLANTDGNIKIAQAGGDVQFNLADDVKVKNDLTVGGDTAITGNTTIAGMTNMNGGAIISNSLTVNPNTNVNFGGNKITNVAAGTADTDGVNVSQLNDLADKPLTFKADAGTDLDRKLGETVVVKGADNNISTTTTPDGVNIALAKTLDLGPTGSVQMGNTLVDNNGLTIAGGPSVTLIGGVNAGGKVISNVAPGVAGTDGVNVDQLKDVDATASAGWHLTANGASSTNVKPTETVDLTNATDNNIVVSKGTDTNPHQVRFGLADNVTIANNLKVGGNSEVTGNATIGGSTSIGGSASIGGAMSVAGASHLAGGATISKELVVSPNTDINMGGNKVHGVAAGTADTDGVNVSQLNALANKPLTFKADAGADLDRKLGETVTIKGADSNISTVTTSDGVNVALSKNLDLGAAGSVLMGDTLINGTGLTIHGGPSITLAGINAGNKVITNVAPGVAGTDAVNVNQLNKVDETANKGWHISASGANSSNVKPDGMVDLSPTDGNIVIEKLTTDNDIKFALADSLDLGAVNVNKNLTVKGDTNLGDTFYVTPGAINVAGGTTINMGGNKITNVAKAENNGDVVVYEQLGELDDAVTTKGLNFAGNEGADVHRDLGTTLAIQGEATTAGDYSGANLKTVTDPVTGAINIQMAEAPEFKAVATNDLTVNNNLTVKHGATINMGGNKVTNVAAGTDKTDAVNVGQLDDVSEVANRGWNLKADGKDESNVAPGGTVDLANTDKNIVIEKDATDPNKVLFNLAREISIDQITTGNTIMNTEGITIAGGPNGPISLTNQGLTAGSVIISSVSGINAGGHKITNVAAGTALTDGVNVSQLKDVQQNVDDLGDRAVKYDGKAGDPKNQITLEGAKSMDGGKTGGTTISNLAQGEVSKNSTEAINGSQLHDMGEQVAGSLGGNSKFVGGKLVTELNVGGNIYNNVNDALDGLNTDIENVNNVANAGWNVQTNGGDTSKVAPGKTVNFKDGQNIKITNDGLNITVATADDITVKSVTANKVIAEEVTIKDGPTINKGGIDMHDKQITNLAAGVEDQDAVNVSQLNKATGDLNSRVDNLSGKVNQVDNRASAGIAAALATAGLPQAYLPGKSMFSVAGGTWRGETGYAMGLSTVSDNGKWVVKGSATSSSRGDYGGSVGVGYQW